AVIMGTGLAALGVWLLSGRHFAVILAGMRASEGSGYRSIFTFGVAYAVGSLSCTLPIFLLVVGAGLAAGSAVGTVGVFLAYGLGMSTLLMLLCLGTAGFKETLVRKIRGLFPHLNRISGGLLLVGGGYIAYYWISLLSGSGKSGAIRFMQEVQRGAQDFVLAIDQRVWVVIGAALALGAILLVWRRGARVETPENEVGETMEDVKRRTR
ncbi:MAG: cytochrome c biogenesis CcdA family protein, partial [Candidatus Methylomirabilales bacterium]